MPPVYSKRTLSKAVMLVAYTGVLAFVSWTLASSNSSLPSTSLPGRKANAQTPVSQSSRTPAPPLPPPPAPINPFSLPGLVINRPIDPKLPANSQDVLGVYDNVKWWPTELPKPEAAKTGDLGYEEEEGVEGDGDLMKGLRDMLKEEAWFGPPWDWARDKTILTIGDSINRNNVAAFASHVGHKRTIHKYEDNPLGSKWQESHSMSVIDIPGLGLKLANWFHQGMIETELETFYKGENLPHRFEKKLESVFLSSLSHPKGLDGRKPDLIIFETLTWDLVFLSRLAWANGDKRFEGRPLDDIELEWYRGRVLEVLQTIQKTFPEAKIVIQTPHHGSRPESHVFSPLRAFQQGQALHSVSHETGHPIFDWGRVVSPLTNELQDGLHFRPGVATWLWGEMALYYLRAISHSPSPIFSSPSASSSSASLGSSPDPQSSSSSTSSRITQQHLVQSYKSERKMSQVVATF